MDKCTVMMVTPGSEGHVIERPMRCGAPFDGDVCKYGHPRSWSAS